MALHMKTKLLIRPYPELLLEVTSDVLYLGYYAHCLYVSLDRRRIKGTSREDTNTYSPYLVFEIHHLWCITYSAFPQSSKCHWDQIKATLRTNVRFRLYLRLHWRESP
jgi:hypothetical protein